MMLAAVKGTTLTVQADGPDQQKALKAVADLVKGGSVSLRNLALGKVLFSA